MSSSAQHEAAIPGYDYGTARSVKSPVSNEESRELEQTAGWTDEDARLLQKYSALFAAHAEEMVDAWRAKIAAQQHRAKWFFGPEGKPDDQYKAAVKRRFVQWVVDVATRPHDEAWLNYQEEIGRHTPEKKNKTDQRQPRRWCRCGTCWGLCRWSRRLGVFLKALLVTKATWMHWKVPG